MQWSIYLLNVNNATLLLVHLNTVFPLSVKKINIYIDNLVIIIYFYE